MLDDIQGYKGYWAGEDGDIIIGGVDEGDMLDEELSSIRQSVTFYTKKQVLGLLGQRSERVKMTSEELEAFKKMYNDFDLFTEAIQFGMKVSNPFYVRLKSDDKEQAKKWQYILSKLYSEFNPDHPEETIEVIPTKKWLVRGTDNPNYYLITTDVFTTEPYGYLSKDELDEAQPFDTEEEAKLWTTPVTEAVLLAVGD